MSKNHDIPVDQAFSYLQHDRLGDLTIDIPAYKDRGGENHGGGEINTGLAYLLRNVVYLDNYETQTTPKNILVIGVFGSVLYRHFEQRTQTITHTKMHWLLGERKRTETVPVMPKDFDAFVITKRPLINKEVIIPKETRATKNGPRISEAIVEQMSGVSSAANKKDEYGYLHADRENSSSLPLHVAYRSTRQLQNGVKGLDFLSQEIAEYGVPIFGGKDFYKIVQGMKRVIRKPLHRIVWGEDDGVLSGEIIPSGTVGH